MEPTREWHAGAGGSHENYMKHSHLLLLAGLLFQPTRQQPYRTAPGCTTPPPATHPHTHPSLRTYARYAHAPHIRSWKTRPRRC